MTYLAPLLCGTSSKEGLGKVALDQLTATINNFSSRALSYLESDVTADVVTFGPFCSRVILENGFAAILGRLDPFRLLYLSEFQTQPQYTLGKRVKSSFSWTGDVIPQDALNALWDADHDTAKIARSLFGRHFDHVYWQPAVENVIDYLGELSELPPELVEIFSSDPKKFVDITKGSCMQLYSQLSKGVHWEYFSSAIQMDEVTVKNLMRETLITVAGVGLVSQFIPTAYASLSPQDAVAHFVKLRKAVQ
jgi:hypothetical protein